MAEKQSSDTPWFREWFGESYLTVYARRDRAEAERAIDLISPLLPEPRDEGLILDVCCGAGRHLAELVRRGYRVCGLDLSGTLLRVAKSELPTSDVVQGYMHALPFRERTFTAVTNFFTSFGYYEDDAVNIATLSEWSRVLKPSGVLVLDYFNSAQAIKNLVPQSVEPVPGGSVHITRMLSADRKRIEKEIVIVRRDGSRETHRESLRLFSPADFHGFLKDAGFVVTATFGSFAGDQLTEGSERAIFIAKRT